MTAGNAESCSTPSPAVRLVPTNRMTGRASTPAVSPGGCRVAGSGFRQAAASAQSRTIAASILAMLSAQNLTKVYLSGGRPLTVLREVSLAVEPGGFLAV